MHVNKFYGTIGRHFETNFWLYVVSLLCVSTGIVLGIYTVKYMSGAQKTDLLSYFTSFTTSIANSDVDKKYVLIQTIKNNFPMILALWLLGLTIVGIPIILIIDIVKGFTLGFSATFIIIGMGLKGFWMTLVGLIPQNIIYIPCFIIASVLGMELSMYKLKDKFNKGSKGFASSQNITYSITFIIILLVMTFGFIYEAYITPRALKVVVSSIGSAK
jgi:stage II sporulation protein M